MFAKEIVFQLMFLFLINYRKILSKIVTKLFVPIQTIIINKILNVSSDRKLYKSSKKCNSANIENKMDGGHVGFPSVFERSLFYTNF